MNLDGTALTAIFSVIGAIFAGTGLKIVEKWLQKTKDKDDTATNLRNELRSELTALKKELADAGDSIDEWKAKYYDVIEKYILVKAQLNAVLKILSERGIEAPTQPEDLTGGPKK
jgi:archaellum component FlaC